MTISAGPRCAPRWPMRPCTQSVAGVPRGARPARRPSSTSAVPSSTPTPALRTATQWAAAIKQPTTSKIVTLTENNDPNDLIGRPNGYTDAAVIEDKRVSCTSEEFGTDCGAMIEIWSTPAAATSRAKYLVDVQSHSPVLGSEWHEQRGKVLLRVTGRLKLSQAKAYEEAFTKVHI